MVFCATKVANFDRNRLKMLFDQLEVCCSWEYVNLQVVKEECIQSKDIIAILSVDGNMLMHFNILLIAKQTVGSWDRIYYLI